MQLRAKILGTNFKKKHPSSTIKSKKIPPSQHLIHNVFQSGVFVTPPSVPGISERTGGIGESFARSWAGHEWQVISCPQRWWRWIFDAVETLELLWPLKVRPCTDRKRKCKKEVGGRRCGKFGRIACGLLFFLLVRSFYCKLVFLTIPPLDSKDVFDNLHFFCVWRDALRKWRWTCIPKLRLRC